MPSDFLTVRVSRNGILPWSSSSSCVNFIFPLGSTVFKWSVSFWVPSLWMISKTTSTYLFPGSFPQLRLTLLGCGGYCLLLQPLHEEICHYRTDRTPHGCFKKFSIDSDPEAVQWRLVLFLKELSFKSLSLVISNDFSVTVSIKRDTTSWELKIKSSSTNTPVSSPSQVVWN